MFDDDGVGDLISGTSCVTHSSGLLNDRRDILVGAPHHMLVYMKRVPFNIHWVCTHTVGTSHLNHDSYDVYFRRAFLR